jgi:hypothetical protein
VHGGAAPAPPLHSPEAEASARADLRVAIATHEHAATVAASDTATAARASAMLADAEADLAKRFGELDARLTDFRASAIRDGTDAVLPTELVDARQARSVAQEGIAELIGARDLLVLRRERSSAALRDATDARNAAADIVAYHEVGKLFAEREAARLVLEALDETLLAMTRVSVNAPPGFEALSWAIRSAFRETPTSFVLRSRPVGEAAWRAHVAELASDADAMPGPVP